MRTMQRAGQLLGFLGAWLAGSSPAFANDGWAFGTQRGSGPTICYMVHHDDDRPIMVMHMLFPGKGDAGIVGIAFRDSAFTGAAIAKHPVQLEFDTGTVEGYRLKQGSGGFIDITMMTYALTDLFAMFEQATRLDVVSSGARASFDLVGFAAALSELRSCADGGVRPG